MKNKYDLDIGKLQSTMLGDFHRLMLQALRQREQDVIKYIAILAPALGGYVWLLSNDELKAEIFVTGTIGVIFLLFLGAVYTVALGYNYRYITLQLAKFETLLGIQPTVLRGWPRSARVFEKKYGRCCIPPEIIRVFWLAFMAAILGVWVSAMIKVNPHTCERYWSIFALVVILIIPALIIPLCYGRKMKRLCSKERRWTQIETTGSRRTGE